MEIQFPETPEPEQSVSMASILGKVLGTLLALGLVTLCLLTMVVLFTKWAIYLWGLL